MKRKIDWLQFGQFLALVMELWKIIKEEFAKMKVGPEIIEWLIGPGKNVFRQFLTNLSEEYMRALEREKPLVAEVDLDLDPVPPFLGARLVRHAKQGKVRLEYRSEDDELYVNGRKVIPWLNHKQKAGWIFGMELEKEAQQHSPLNATLADWLYEHEEFIPKKWRGQTWFFWVTIWEGHSMPCARFLYWQGNQWFRYYRWMGDLWRFDEPSASLEAA